MSSFTMNIPNPLLLARYRSVADGLATLFFPYVEVVIHDLGTQTVTYLANNLSKRCLGDESALDDVAFDPDETVIGPYEKLNWDGRTIRSISIVARDDHEVPIGLVCINFDVSVLEHTKAALDLFLAGVRLSAQPDKLFRDDWQERINTFLHTWLQARHLSLATLSREHKRQLVEALYAEGAFKGKSAADYVSNILNMGRATVFKYLKELRDKTPSMPPRLP